jgi:chemotaxis protein histidine kinase CheA
VKAPACHPERSEGPGGWAASAPQVPRYARDDSRKWFVVVTRSGDKTVGLLVDALVKQQEIVIKSIGQRLKTIPGIAGATVIGEGEIVLVIDAASLIDHFGGRARENRSLVN